MNELLIGLIGALLSTNPPAAASQLLAQATGVEVRPVSTDPVEQEYLAIMEEDDAARADIDQWILERTEQGDRVPSEAEEASFRARIRERLGQVRKRYEGFIRKHPDHSRIRLAFGSYFMEIGEEELGREQWDKALELDPSDPAAWNNLANYYGHNSPVTKSFEYYQKAIDLDPTESVYHFNFATTVYLFRRDATNYFRITESEVFDKAMGLYAKALELDPTNFVLATDLANSYYGIKHFYKLKKEATPEVLARVQTELSDKAIAAWQVAFKLARDDIERQGVYVHLARNHIEAKRFEEAQRYLDNLKDDMFGSIKRTLSQRMARERVGKQEPASEPSAAADL